MTLEWVYGLIIPKSEQVMNEAKHGLGRWKPTASQAHKNLRAALKEQSELITRAKKSRELLSLMLDARKKLGDLVEKSGFVLPESIAVRRQNVDSSNLPDDLMIELLVREEVLICAKLHSLEYDQMMEEKQLCNLDAIINQVGITNWGYANEAKDLFYLLFLRKFQTIERCQSTDN